MNRDERIELKPCPFCGKTPIYRQGVTLKRNQLPQWNVYCSLDADDSCPLARKPFSVEQWNTRTEREAVLVAALDEAREILAVWLIGVEYPESLKAYSIIDNALKEYRGER